MLNRIRFYHLVIIINKFAIKRFYFLHFSLLMLTIGSKAQSQSSLQDSAFYKQSLNSLTENYKAELGPNIRLYYGPEYIRDGRKARGFPFWESNDFLTGSIFYNGALYQDVKMQYDLVSDGLVIRDYTNNNTSMRLVNEKLDYFSFPNHYFVHLAPDKAFSSLLKSGFYEQLHTAPVSLYARREKRMVLPVNTDEEPRYEQLDFYFVKINNSFFSVEGKNSLLDILKDKKDELKKYIRANKINFKRNLEQALIQTIDYYAQIKA